MNLFHSQLLLTFVTVLHLVHQVTAGSFGMGSCDAGIAAIAGTHLDYGPTSPSMRQGAQLSFEDAELVVLLDGTTLIPNTQANFRSNTDLTWTILSELVPYKGLLVRVQSNESNVFTNVGIEDTLQGVGLCAAFSPENVEAVCHNSPSLKSNNSGVLYFSGEGPVIMDISIVFENTVTSLYAFASFPLWIGEVTLDNTTEDIGRCNFTRGDGMGGFGGFRGGRGGNFTGSPNGTRFDDFHPGGNHTGPNDGFFHGGKRPPFADGPFGGFGDGPPGGNGTRFGNGPPEGNGTQFGDGPTGDNSTRFGNHSDIFPPCP
jgi:hypothetical protein